MDTLREFTANASHQMRTPLAVVRVHLDVLERHGPASPRGVAALEDIATAVTSLERLLLQLISLARTEEQGIPADATFDLAAVASDILAARVVQPGLETMDIGFESEDDGPVAAFGHPVLAAEMIGNLFDNAVRYNRPDGVVTVRVLRREGAARIEVEDNGPGIPAADLERVFERFYRAHAEASPPGSGLGLSIVRALAERMGARVSLNAGAAGRGVLAAVDFTAPQTIGEVSNHRNAPHAPSMDERHEIARVTAC